MARAQPHKAQLTGAARAFGRGLAARFALKSRSAAQLELRAEGPKRSSLALRAEVPKRSAASFALKSRSAARSRLALKSRS